MLLRPFGAMYGCRGDCGPAAKGRAARGLPRNGWTDPANGSCGMGTAGVLAAAAELPSAASSIPPTVPTTTRDRRMRDGGGEGTGRDSTTEDEFLPRDVPGPASEVTASAPSPPGAP